MGYMVYNRSLYRNGFRPYRETNPAAAASGMGGTPFDPEFLHGARRQPGYPFSDRGGWRLGGLGDAAGAPTGSSLLYTATWQLSPSHESAAQILASVLQILQQSSSVVGFQVTNASQNSGLLTVSNFTVQIALFVSGPGFAQPNDAGSFVDHAYNQVTGLMPVVSSTVVTQLPSGVEAAPAPTGTSPFPGGAGLPTDLTSWVENNVWWLALIAAGAFVLPRVL